MKVALLGPEGTYTHQATRKHFEDFNPIFCSTIEQVFDSSAEKIVVPFENTLGGGISETIDFLREKNYAIESEEKISIDHVLLSKEDKISEVDKVVSHPQAFNQCRKYLSDRDWTKKESTSTAQAAKNLGENEAAIASRLAGKINGLNVLEEDLQDMKSNVTRFMVLGEEPGEGDKTGLILDPEEDRPGLLSNMLSCFSGHGINLSFIQSRPKRTEMGEYFFFVEAESSRKSENFDKSVKCLETYCDVEVLGSYGVING